MNWDAVGAIAELLGAVAVVVSLVYLASQVRTGTRAMRTTMRDAAFRSLQEWNYVVLGQPDLSWIYQRGLKDPTALDEMQSARFVNLMYSWFKLFENIYLHSREGSIDPEVWEHNKNIFAALVHQPGAKKYLEHRRQVFDPTFVEMLEGLRAPETVLPSGDLAEALGSGRHRSAPMAEGEGTTDHNTRQ